MKFPVLMGALYMVTVTGVALLLSTVILPAPTASQQHAARPDASAASLPPSDTAPPATPQASATPPKSTSTAAAKPTSPAPSASATVQYAEQLRSVIDQAAQGAYTTDSNYAIGRIPQDTPALVDGENVELVRANCSVCHATTFISSQPPLPATTWHDEVYKMKEKYGATFISDENADKIIAYLSAHYTPETHQGVATP